MAFDINTFRGNLVGGGARPSQFEVILKSTIQGIPNSFTFMCKSASLPGHTIGSVAVPYFGRTINVAGDREPPAPWTVTIINDESFDVRDALIRWQSQMASHTTTQQALRVGAATSNPRSYIGSATVYQYGKEGNIIKEVNLINCFPTDIGLIQLSWEAANQIEEFDCTFVADYITEPGVTF